MLGGASGTGGSPGERNGQYRHGERTKATIAEQRKFSALLKMLRWPNANSGECAGIVDTQAARRLDNISGLPQGLAGRPAAGWSRRGDGAENTGVRALGINGATSESARLTELPLAGICHGFRELPRPVRC